MAFEIGLNAASTISKEIINTKSHRDVGWMDGLESEEPLWGIYAQSDHQLQWKLPTERDVVFERKQTLLWLKWWGAYIFLGVIGLLSLVAFQVKESQFLLTIIPLFFFFAPIWATIKSNLRRSRLNILLSLQAVLFFGLLFLWMDDDIFWYFIFFLVGNGFYFFILPTITGVSLKNQK